MLTQESKLASAMPKKEDDWDIGGLKVPPTKLASWLLSAAIPALLLLTIIAIGLIMAFRSTGTVKLPRFRGHRTIFGLRSPRWARQEQPTRLSSAARWLTWYAPAARRRSWRVSSNRRHSRSGTGWPSVSVTPAGRRRPGDSRARGTQSTAA